MMCSILCKDFLNEVVLSSIVSEPRPDASEILVER